MKLRLMTILFLLLLFAASYAQTSLDFGSSLTGTISANDHFQTYTIDVPADTSFLVIYLDGEDVDLDMAIKYGSEITDYDGGADFVDQSPSPDAIYVLNNPPAGTYYVDVINYIGQDSDYTLSANSSLPAGDTSLTAETTEATTIGILAINAQATGALTSSGGSEYIQYHTYIISVPEGTSHLKIEMRADKDLDLYARYGSDITDYSDKSIGGDWDHRNNSRRHRATFNIRNPQAGLWYVDIVNARDNSEAVDYSLSISDHR